MNIWYEYFFVDFFWDFGLLMKSDEWGEKSGIMCICVKGFYISGVFFSFIF